MTDIASSSSEHGGWYVVSQVKTHRVVYFTDDPQFQPASFGDWYFVSHHRGDLPQDMTLRNCWSWRHDGQAFRSANDPLPDDAPERLLDSNRKALHTLLRELVDAQRRPWLPSSALGETLRAAKLAEARVYQAAARQGGAPQETPLLAGLAAARAISVAEAAALVLERHDAALAALVAGEAARERFAYAIDRAITNDELVAARRELLATLEVGQLAGLPPVPTPMTPAELNDPLPSAAREIEVARLKTQLRHAINRMRSRIDDGYDQNDGLLKHKAKLAQAVLSNEGRAPAGLDVQMLANIADRRSLALADAARLVLGAVTEGESILRRTEHEKDRFLALIDAAKSLQEFNRIGEEVHAFARRAPGA